MDSPFIDLNASSSSESRSMPFWRFVTRLRGYWSSCSSESERLGWEVDVDADVESEFEPDSDSDSEAQPRTGLGSFSRFTSRVEVEPIHHTVI